MSITSDLAYAEKRLAALINSRADSEEREARADRAERVRADDARCADLAASYQEDYAAHGVSAAAAQCGRMVGRLRETAFARSATPLVA